ncbi:paired small multidrug resistance pump [Aliicoccus persicus]|uniref:Paired small multidrug resistance pump n=2 Tax=Aliicoccus persicus TaxID=930138 RepID=A0A662Z5Q2_9STAP|nr:SMR family transporter [Aliicoccus persicus]SEW18243.1 paired small multidrug resistance pump [Aliicoccus persicus]
MWILVVIAAIFEIGWATGLKYANDFTTWSLTAIAIIVSFGLLVYAGTKLPTSTVYAVFVGLGTVGTVLIDFIFFELDFSFGIVFFILLLLVGILGLKTVTDDDVKKESPL